MSAAFELLENVPIPAYTFRVVPGDFLLAAVNAVARANNPVIQELIGRSITSLYRDHPQAVADGRRCADERTTVVSDRPTSWCGSRTCSSSPIT
jgi:hypothetical protein